jgi:hypothetical protein
VFVPGEQVLGEVGQGPYVPHADRAAVVFVERDGAWYTARADRPVESVEPERRLFTVTPGASVARPVRARAGELHVHQGVRELVLDRLDRGDR